MSSEHWFLLDNDNSCGYNKNTMTLNRFEKIQLPHFNDKEYICQENLIIKAGFTDLDQLLII